MKIIFKRIDLKDLSMNVYEYFRAIMDDFPAAIFIEPCGGEPNVVVKAYTATTIIPKIVLEILESFKEIQYTDNNPEKWVEEELKRIIKAINKYEDILHDSKLLRVFIRYVTDGDSVAYVIAFRD